MSQSPQASPLLSACSPPPHSPPARRPHLVCPAANTSLRRRTTARDLPQPAALLRSEAQDFSTTHSYAHTMKGTAASAGCSKLMVECKQLMEVSQGQSQRCAAAQLPAAPSRAPADTLPLPPPCYLLPRHFAPSQLRRAARAGFRDICTDIAGLDGVGSQPGQRGRSKSQVTATRRFQESPPSAPLRGISVVSDEATKHCRWQGSDVADCRVRSADFVAVSVADWMLELESVLACCCALCVVCCVIDDD